MSQDSESSCWARASALLYGQVADVERRHWSELESDPPGGSDYAMLPAPSWIWGDGARQFGVAWTRLPHVTAMVQNARTGTDYLILVRWVDGDVAVDTGVTKDGIVLEDRAGVEKPVAWRDFWQAIKPYVSKLDQPRLFRLLEALTLVVARNGPENFPASVLLADVRAIVDAGPMQT